MAIALANPPPMHDELVIHTVNDWLSEQDMTHRDVGRLSSWWRSSIPVWGWEAAHICCAFASIAQGGAQRTWQAAGHVMLMRG